MFLLILGGLIAKFYCSFETFHNFLYISTHVISKYCPAGIWCENDVGSTSMRRHHVASTLIRRHFGTKCPLGDISKEIFWDQKIYFEISVVLHELRQPGRVAQSVGHLTRNSGVLGSIPGLATHFRFSFRFFKKGSCQLLAKVCARSAG